MALAKTKDQTAFHEAFERLPSSARREAKEKAALEIIIEQPLQGVTKINQALIEKFGPKGTLSKDWLTDELRKERLKHGHPVRMRPSFNPKSKKGAPVTALTAVTALPVAASPAPPRLDLPGAVASIVAALTPFDEKHRRRIIEAITILMFERPEA